MKRNKLRCNNVGRSLQPGTSLPSHTIIASMFSDFAHCWCCLASQVPGNIQHLTKTLDTAFMLQDHTKHDGKTKLIMHTANYNTVHGQAFLQTHSPSVQGFEPGCLFTLQKKVTDPGCRMVLTNLLLLQRV